MIRIHREPYCLTVNGHATDGKTFSPVCAAVSALVYTLAALVADLAAESRVTDVLWVLQPGDARISCRPKRGENERVAQGFQTVCRGFELLCTQFPDQVRYE
jgi:uncharacterized protein YsxB (DUF464 family)